jgi:hypothetical protein
MMAESRRAAYECSVGDSCPSFVMLFADWGSIHPGQLQTSLSRNLAIGIIARRGELHLKEFPPFR